MISELLQKKVDRAIRLLRSVKTEPGEFIELAYSGGKDSDVILELAKMAGIPYKAIYKNTTIDPPGTIQHAIDMGAEVLRPKENFFTLMCKKGFPSRNYRFCCQELKEKKTEGFSKTIIGVRREESTKRAKNYQEPTKCIGTKKKPREGIYPILDWTADDVRQFVEARGIKCHKLYYDDKGNFHPERRLGCMCCPLAYYKNRQKEFKKYPGMVRFYLRAGRAFLNDHPDSKVKGYYKDEYEYFARNLFFDAQSKWDAHKNGFFGSEDYKKLLEEFFQMDLTL